MHGLVDAAHVDHLHPDSGIALACAADGEKLTAECFGDTVVWVPWRRPGFQLGLDVAAVKAARPRAIGCVLGGTGSPRGVTPPRSASGTRCTSSVPPSGSSPSRAGPSRSGRWSRGTRRCPRWSGGSGRPLSRRTCGRSPRRTGRRWGTSTTPTPYWTSWRGPSTLGWPRWGRRVLTTSCAPRCGRSCWICRRPRRSTRRSPGWTSCTPSTARSTPPTTSGTRSPTPPRCVGRTPRSCWFRAWACSASARTSRRRGWPGSSTSTPST